MGIDNDNIKSPGNTYVKVCHSDEERGQLVVTEGRCVLQPSKNCQHKSLQVLSSDMSVDRCLRCKYVFILCNCRPNVVLSIYTFYLLFLFQQSTKQCHTECLLTTKMVNCLNSFLYPIMSSSFLYLYFC